MRNLLAAPLCVALLLAACSAEPQSEPVTTTETSDSEAPQIGSDAAIELSAIGEGELLALDGELGCSFTIEGQPGPALVAKADVGPDATAQGAYKMGNSVQRVAGPGGFRALEKGMELSGPGMLLTVERLADAPTDTGTEETSVAARLTASRTYGGERSYDGVWTCGP